MASIMKRGDSYSVRYKYKDHSGKPCEGWESFKTKKEAQERKITVEKELLDGTFLVPDTMTVEEMLYKWIPIQSTKHKWSPKTYTQSVAMVQNLIVPYIGNRKVQELRTYDIEKFYATLAKTPCGQYVHGVKQPLTEKQKKRLLSSTSIHEVHTLLKTAFSYAVEWDLIHKIPLPRDAPKVNIEERTIWDEKTMLAALQTIENPALHLAVHMSMILSLREGEILGLQPSDLDFDSYCWSTSSSSNVFYVDMNLKTYRCTCTVGRSRYSLFDFSYENLTNYRPVAVTCNSYAECKDCKIGGFCGGGCQLSHQIDFKKCCTYEEEVFSHFMKTLFIPYIKSKYNEVNQNERKAENRCT